jgi:hypothetical protein
LFCHEFFPGHGSRFAPFVGLGSTEDFCGERLGRESLILGDIRVNQVIEALFDLFHDEELILEWEGENFLKDAVACGH